MMVNRITTGRMITVMAIVLLLGLLYWYMFYYQLDANEHFGNGDDGVKIILAKEDSIKKKWGIYWDAVIIQGILSSVPIGDAKIMSQNDAKQAENKSLVNIFIEDIDEGLLSTAKTNIFFINQDIRFTKLVALTKLKPSDWIICKSDLAYNTLQSRGLVCGIIKLGFTSLSKYDPAFAQQKNFKKVLHIGGKSWMKNTLLVLKTYIEYPALGAIDIVCSEMCLMQGGVDDSGKVCSYEKDEWKNLMLYIKHNKELRDRIQIFLKLEDIVKDNGEKYTSINEIFMTYGIHICPSEIEGWGHYLYEAMSCGNIVITTNRSPMNEYIMDKQNGFIVKSFEGEPQLYGTYGHFNLTKMKFRTGDLYDTISEIQKLEQKKLQEIGGNARNTYLEMDRNFKAKFAAFMNKFVAAPATPAI